MAKIDITGYILEICVGEQISLSYFIESGIYNPSDSAIRNTEPYSNENTNVMMHELSLHTFCDSLYTVYTRMLF